MRNEMTNGNIQPAILERSGKIGSKISIINWTLKKS